MPLGIAPAIYKGNKHPFWRNAMKALAILILTILAMNVTYAGYGEDMKGECVKGKDSGRDQEVIVEDSSAKSTKSTKSTTAGK